jgi:hypothetical protein
MAVAHAPDRVELRVQPMPTGEFEQVVDRLEALQAAGHVGEYTVRTWDRYVDVDDQLARELGEATPTTAGVGRMGTERDVRRLPRAALVEYYDGRVVEVTTCEEGLLDRLSTVATTASGGGRLQATPMGGAD